MTVDQRPHCTVDSGKSTPVIFDTLMIQGHTYEIFLQSLYFFNGCALAVRNGLREAEQQSQDAVCRRHGLGARPRQYESEHLYQVNGSRGLSGLVFSRGWRADGSSTLHLPFCQYLYLIEGSSGLRIFTRFFKMRWWQIGGEAKLLCIITLVLWHVRVVARVSFQLLGLSDDELDPLCPPVPFLWDPLNCTPFGTGNCFDVSPFGPCNVNSLSTEHSILSVCLWLGTAEKGNSWASQTPAKGKPSLKFSCKWPESKESI